MPNTNRCVIVGGGPAGMVAGLILARCGIPVTVLEKHDDFLRDFRGDTIHPSTLLLLRELGLDRAFERIGYSKVESVQLPASDGGRVTVANPALLSHPYPYVAMAPQWDFLNLLADAGEREKHFTLLTGAEVTSAVVENGRVRGVNYTQDGTDRQLQALLVIAADGRSSTLRRQLNLPMREYRTGIDVWWFRLNTALAGVPVLAPRGLKGSFFVLIPRRSYLQTGMLIAKGRDGQLRRRGIEAFREDIARVIPEAAQAAEQLTFEDVKLLDVQVNRAKRWWTPGLLCIGDAAHAMSPVGGVGVNLAVQDAVAAARILADPLRHGSIGDADVAAVQRRRQLPAALIQSVQRIMHIGLRRLLRTGGSVQVPGIVARVLRRFPGLGVLPAWLLMIGPRTEEVPFRARRAAPEQTPQAAHRQTEN